MTTLRVDDTEVTAQLNITKKGITEQHFIDVDSYSMTKSLGDNIDVIEISGFLNRGDTLVHFSGDHMKSKTEVEKWEDILK